MPGTLRSERLSTTPGSDLRQLTIQYNNLVRDAQVAALAGSTDAVWSWQTAAANSGQALGRGSTDTALASGKLTAGFGGIPETKAAVTTGTALTAETVPADTWALYALDMVTGGTLSVAPAALNTTGYATEALAIAAQPARITLKARLGYITVKTMVATAWIGATDALAGGTTGNEASVTNYYPNDGLFAPTGQSFGPNAVVTAAVGASGSAWTGGRNGVLVATVLDRGSTDTNVESTAFVYSANGVTNINKAAVTAGTALGALGTTPAGKWALFAMYINSVGTITYLAGPSNTVTGYGTEAAAIADLNKLFPTATASGGITQMGYVTVQAQAANAWIAGTDALAGGTSGNEAQTSNYYPTPGVTLLQGQSASLIANRSGVVVTSANY